VLGEVLVTLVSVRVIYKSQVDFFFLDGELVYKRHNGTPSEIKAKVVCGAQQADEIFKDFHASSHGAHTGQKKTRDAISRRFYWPGMSDDIDTWVRHLLTLSK